VDAPGPRGSRGTGGGGAGQAGNEPIALPGCHPTPCSVLGCAADRHRCRTGKSYQSPPTTQAETSECPGEVTSSRGWNPLQSRRSRTPHTPSATPRPGTSISRIAPRSQQDQVIRSRRSRSRGPGTNHPLSRKAPGATVNDWSPGGPTIKASMQRKADPWSRPNVKSGGTGQQMEGEGS
jgi:hypothetical protein